MSDCKVQERMEKHIDIDNAVDYLERLVARISLLRDRISGNNQLDEPAAEKTMPSLSNVLNTSANSIRNNCDNAYKILEEIEELLF